MRPGQVSIFNLDEYQQLALLTGVEITTFPQCPMGSYSMKPTTVMHFKAEFPVHMYPRECPHPPSK